MTSATIFLRSVQLLQQVSSVMQIQVAQKVSVSLKWKPRMTPKKQSTNTMVTTLKAENSSYPRLDPRNPDHSIVTVAAAIAEVAETGLTDAIIIVAAETVSTATIVTTTTTIA